MENDMDSKREFLRHTVATLAYRGGKAVRDAPDGFAGLSVSETTRTPLQILAHINDLVDWAISMANSERKWNDSVPQAWQGEVDRFFATLELLDRYLSSEAPLHAETEKLFQGPVADALTHVGELPMLCRIGGTPIRAENYFKADIQTGR